MSFFLLKRGHVIKPVPIMWLGADEGAMIRQVPLQLHIVNIGVLVLITCGQEDGPCAVRGG